MALSFLAWDLGDAQHLDAFPGERDAPYLSLHLSNNLGTCDQAHFLLRRERTYVNYELSPDMIAGTTAYCGTPKTPRIITRSPAENT